MKYSGRVTFLQVASNQEKAASLCHLVQQHFADGEKVMIFTSSPEAAAYVDQLLWKFPEESFLPHQISEERTQEIIAITTQSVNINDATILFNLSASLCPIYAQFDLVYELMDKTDLQKLNLSKKRLEAYQSMEILPVIKGFHEICLL